MVGGVATTGTLSATGGAELVLEIDCDFSHDPADVPRLIATCDSGADLALGSRWVEGGGDARRCPGWREREQRQLAAGWTLKEGEGGEADRLQLMSSCQC